MLTFEKVLEIFADYLAADETIEVYISRPVQIGCELEDLQKAVGGDIEATYPFNEPVALLMHDEGNSQAKT